MQYSGFIQKVFQKLEKLDLNEIKNIMVELSTEKELYKLVFDSMIEGVIVTNKDNKVILINKSMEEFISVSKNKILFQELENSNFSPEIRDVVNSTLENNQKVIDKEVHVHRTDKTFILSILSFWTI